MIHESSYWKRDLLKVSDRLERRLVQTRWGQKNLYALEKEIFIGFYSVRKLIESRKVSSSMKSKTYEVMQFSYRGCPESILGDLAEDAYDFSKANKRRVSIHQLCNQFIHSHYFVPFLPNGRNLTGFFFCSDRERRSCIYLITMFDVIDIYRAIGNNYPATLCAGRLPNGGFFKTVE